MNTLVVVLVNGLWQAPLIAAITWLVLRFWPNVNASTRYAAWTLALVAIVIVPVVTSLGRVSYETHRQASVTVAHPVSSNEGRSTRSETSASVPSSPQIALPQAPSVRVAPPALLPLALVALWALAALVLIIRLGVALLQLERLKRDALPLPMEYRETLEQWQRYSTHSRDVRICVTSGIEVPVAVGLFDAMVLLPQHLLETLESGEVDQISLHELSHLLRHDDWSNAFQRVAIALLFFNPAVWFIARQMDIEREVACDDFVLELTGAVRTYAYCLTKMAEMTSWPHQPLAAPGVFVTRKNISIRIERLLRTGRAISSSISPATAAAVIAGLGASYLFARAFTPIIAVATPQAQTIAAATPSPTARPRATAPPERTIDVPRVDVDVPAVHVHVPAVHVRIPQTYVAAATENGIHGGCTGCNFAGARMENRDFSHQNLAASDFDGAHLRSANFGGSNLSGANFANADLRGASFANANLTGADFDGANIEGASFDGAELTGVSISMKKLAPAQARVFLFHCTGCDFSHADLHGQDLRGISMTGTDLSGANLRDADLTGATFTGVDLSGADLSGARLGGATFRGCDFSKTDLRHVDLTHTTFVGSSLGDAQMN